MENQQGSRAPWKPKSVTNNTLFTTTIACALSSLTATFGAAWYIRGAVEGFRQELAELKREQALASSVSWNLYDMNNFAGRLRYDNQKINLIVPEPRELRFR